MAAKTNIQRHHVINAARGTPMAAWTPYAALLSAITSIPAGTVTEITGDGLTRQAITFGAPANGATENSALIAFGTAAAATPDCVGIGIYDAASGGTLRYVAPITAKPITSGDPVEIAIGALDWTED